MKLKTISFEKDNNQAIYLQIYEKIKLDIIRGSLKLNDSLPSIREGVKLFKVSKTSLEHAYMKLMEEGWIISKNRSGYFVDRQIDITPLIENQQLPQEEILYDLRSQNMDLDSFDMQLWKKYLKEVLDQDPSVSSFGDSQGEYLLRKALVQYAFKIRGVYTNPDHIIVGSSYQVLLLLLCGMLKKQCIIAMEKPIQGSAWLPFHNYGFKIELLDRCEEGIDIQQLIDKKVDVIYINSGACGKYHQPMKMRDKKALLKWANDYHTLIIEDDHNGELRYQSKVNVAMQGIDQGGHVLYMGSFSRLILPSIRISYLVCNEQIYQEYQKYKRFFAPTASKIEQLAFAHYLMDGQLQRHVKRLKRKYEEKNSMMKQLLDSYFPSSECILAEASLQYIVSLSPSINNERLVELAKKQGIYIQLNSSGDLLVSFAAISIRNMEEAIKELSIIYHQMLNTKY